MTDEQPLANRLFSLGLAHHKAGDMAAAEQWYQRTLQLLPRYPDAWNNLGILAQNCNNMRVAMDCYIRSLECNGKFAPAWGNLGALFEICGRSDEAARIYEIALAIDPRAEVYSNLASLHRESGRFAEAYRCYAKALGLKAHETGNYTHIHSAWVFTVEQDPDSTIEDRMRVKREFREKLG